MLVPTTVVIINLSWTATLHFATRTATRFVSFRLRDFVVPISGRSSKQGAGISVNFISLGQRLAAAIR
jgi:hypothetical protein